MKYESDDDDVDHPRRPLGFRTSSFLFPKQTRWTALVSRSFGKLYRA